MTPRYNLRNRNNFNATAESRTKHEEKCDEFVQLNVRRMKAKKANYSRDNKSRDRNLSLGFILKRLGLSPATPKYDTPKLRTGRRSKDDSKAESHNRSDHTVCNTVWSSMKQGSALTTECTSEKLIPDFEGEICSITKVVSDSCEVTHIPIIQESPSVHHEKTMIPRIQHEDTFSAKVDGVFRKPLPIQSPPIRDRFLSESLRSQGVLTPLRSPIPKLLYDTSDFITQSPVVLKPFSSPCMRNPFKVPSSPAFSQVHSTQDLPCLLLTPNLGLGSSNTQVTNTPPSVVYTPLPSNQWDSPCVPSEVMSTPFLMKTVNAANCPDLINMIDDELGSVQAFDHSLRLYDHVDLTDIEIVDYVSTLQESFAEKVVERVCNHNSPLIHQKVVQAHAQGRYGKQMTEEMLKAVKAEQKRRDKTRKELKRAENKDASYDERRIQQKIAKNGRRTRSILRKCDELEISLPQLCVQEDEE